MRVTRFWFKGTILPSQPKPKGFKRTVLLNPFSIPPADPPVTPILLFTAVSGSLLESARSKDQTCSQTEQAERQQGQNSL